MEPILYKPFRSYRFFGVLMAFFGVIILVMVVFSTLTYHLLLPIMFAVGCLAFSVYLFCAAKITVVADDTGLQVLHPKHSTIPIIPWNSLKGFHLGNSWRGHEFLVLSSQPLAPKEVKRMVNRSSNSTKLYYDGIIILPMDPIQNTDALRKFAYQKIEYRN